MSNPASFSFSIPSLTSPATRSADGWKISTPTTDQQYRKVTSMMSREVICGISRTHVLISRTTKCIAVISRIDGSASEKANMRALSEPFAAARSSDQSPHSTRP